MGTKIFNLSFPEKLLEIIDNEAKLEYATRSEFIRRAVMAYLKANGISLTKLRTCTPEEHRREQLRQFLEEYEAESFDGDRE